jgi:hypothetical protein
MGWLADCSVQWGTPCSRISIVKRIYISFLGLCMCVCEPARVGGSNISCFINPVRYITSFFSLMDKISSVHGISNTIDPYYIFFFV